ncbi:PREDICTED: uncharacterized protein LOC109589845 [Amphimedon queenslandica]|uniref:Uncharacterized protein n=1 Tax=Amphimedon queenslandica TaxID=400682 RepID=A0A1X7VP82_AMPQE|nr:PREDICTED: uncharacterized protein LOC109589845 [Amphimedon queenslandica]|eukprot:XP_019861401.1 PREDICTED: uncharacterized protein LOC109589845 [Amphimedon queenslandica]
MAEKRAYRRGPAKPWSTRKVVMLKADRKKFDASPELSPFSALLQSREKKKKSAADCDGSYTDTVPIPSKSLCEEEKIVESKEESVDEAEEDEKQGGNEDTEVENAEEEGLKDAFDDNFLIKACSVVALTKLKSLNLSVIQEEEGILPGETMTPISSTPINRKRFVLIIQ